MYFVTVFQHLYVNSKISAATSDYLLSLCRVIRRYYIELVAIQAAIGLDEEAEELVTARTKEAHIVTKTIRAL